MTESSDHSQDSTALAARAAALQEVMEQIGRLAERIDPQADREEALGALLACWLELSSWLDCAVEEAAHELALMASTRSQSPSA